MRFEEFFQKIRENIFYLAQALNFKPTPDQRKAMQIVQYESRLPKEQRKKRIAIRSGQGCGKTAYSCLIMLWRQIQHVDALGIVTAPTQRQLKKVWLAEFRRMILNAHPAIQSFVEVTKSEVVFFNRPNWAIYLVSSAKPENAQGLHQNNMTILCDEMSGIPDEMIEQFYGTLTNSDSLLIGIGNPNFRSGEFFKAFHKDRALWHTLRISAEGCPIVDQSNVKRLEAQFGRNSDPFRVRVLGEFPTKDPNVLFDIADIDSCNCNDPVICASASSIRTFGIDLARFGDDESVIFQRSGNAIIRWERFVKWEPADVLREALRWNDTCGWTDAEFIVDCGGLGGGAVHILHEAGVKVSEFYFNNAASDAQFGNRITEAYFAVKTMVEDREIYIPEDDFLTTDLVERCYVYNRKGQIVIEEKDAFKKRVNRSPDRGDGMILAFAPNTMRGTKVFRKGDPVSDVKKSGVGTARRPGGRAGGRVWRMK